jgi:2-dehydro-3-deoxyphosphooctonate aldolase (KDO 8-P synthase)
MNPIRVEGVTIGRGAPLVLISGPCVLESEEVARRTAGELAELCARHGVPLIFKCSYEKDNRTAARAYRGPGLAAGLTLLERLRLDFGLPVLTDVHRRSDVTEAAALSMLQVPAFLCRQTSLLEAVGRSGRPVNIKKGQFMSPKAMAGAVEKVRGAGGTEILLTERGSSFGPDRVVCDMTSVPALSRIGRPVAFDAGHPAACREDIVTLARCGVAAGADALFVETHPDPDRAPCDGDRMLSIAEMKRLLPELVELAGIVRQSRPALRPRRT